MFAEFTERKSGKPILINTDKIIGIGTVKGSEDYIIATDDSTIISLAITESFEEIKKRLSMSITPRAETIAFRGPSTI